MPVFRTENLNTDPRSFLKLLGGRLLSPICSLLLGFAVLTLLCGSVRGQAPSAPGRPQAGGAGYPGGSGYGEEMMEEDEDMGDEGDGSDRGYGSGDDMGEMMDDMGDDGSGYGDDGGYGGGGDYGGGGGRGTGTRAVLSSPQADALDVYGAPLVSLRDQLSFAPLFAPTQVAVAESGPFLGRDAEDAFKAGNQPLALALMFGHMTVEERAALVALQTVKYNALLRRPIWNIRWGVSLAIRGDITGDAQPIQEGATSSGRGGGGGFGAPGGGGGRGGGRGGDLSVSGGSGGPGGGFPGGGALGGLIEDEGMYEGMDDGMNEGMGDEMGMDQGYGRGSGQPQGGAAGPATPSIPSRKMLSDQARVVFDKNLGLVAKVMGEEFRKRFQSGAFGPLFSTVTAPPPPADNGAGRNGAAPAASSHVVGGAVNELLMEAGEPMAMWQPGIIFLGEGDIADVMPNARAAQVDLLLHFEVVLKAGRNDNVQNTSRCRLMNVATGKQEIVSKGMSNVEAAQMTRAGRQTERDYVMGQLTSLFSFIDRAATVADLPALTPEIARRRVEALVGSPQSRSLRTLAEVRMYQAKNLLTAEEVEAVFDIVGGAEGLVMLHGPQSEKLEMARQWALQSLPSFESQ